MFLILISSYRILSTMSIKKFPESDSGNFFLKKLLIFIDDFRIQEWKNYICIKLIHPLLRRRIIRIDWVLPEYCGVDDPVEVRERDMGSKRIIVFIHGKFQGEIPIYIDPIAEIFFS